MIMVMTIIMMIIIILLLALASSTILSVFLITNCGLKLIEIGFANLDMLSITPELSLL